MASNAKSQGDGSASRKVADAAHEAIERIASAAQDAEDRVRDSVGKARGEASARGEEMKAQAEELQCTLTQAVRENPMATLGVAFVAGIIFSSMLRR